MCKISNLLFTWSLHYAIPTRKWVEYTKLWLAAFHSAIETAIIQLVLNSKVIRYCAKRYFYSQQVDRWHWADGITRVGRNICTCFPLCVLFVSCYLFHHHTPFFLLPKTRVVKGVFALIFCSRLGCLTAKLERSLLAPVFPQRTFKFKRPLHTVCMSPRRAWWTPLMRKLKGIQKQL